MSSIKKRVIKKLYDNIYAYTKLATIEEIAPQLIINRRAQGSQVEFLVDLPVFVNHENEKELQSVELHQPEIETDDIIISSKLVDGVNLHLGVDKVSFVKDVLDSNPTELNFKPQKKKVVVEFSSPNVAKPFHAGHLRSTIIGNFISNIKEKVGKDVMRINYLGDWGTQFGMLKLGVEKMGVDDQQLTESPTKTLYDAYVWINKEVDKDPTLHQQARDQFLKLEEGDEEAKKIWAKVDLVLERLREQGLLTTDAKGRHCGRVRDQLVPLVRSDGATLYLARDIAAALHRRRTTNFNEMLYVVENGQATHFISLFGICQDLGLDNAWNMKHVKFGRIHGMSTRRGHVVFLADILDQARDLVLEGLQASKTSKVKPTVELADALGSAAVIINDLKQRRIKDYEFNWDKALQVSGDTAVRLQYTHCRLHSLLKNSLQSPATSCDPEALSEPEAVALVLEIARFEEAVLRAHAELEACTLVTYLFYLTHAANKAFKVLPVKGSGVHLASQRLLLFSHCKKVLGEGLKLLGITPLDQM